MIVVFSTSSPVASMAAIEDGRLVFVCRGEARQRAGEAVLGWYREADLPADAIRGFVADLGPGGFTGTRVGIVAAKTLAFALGKPCAGLTAFDLIGADLPVVPARRGSYLTRDRIVEGWPEGGEGYGPDAPEPRYPDAANALAHLERLAWVAPERLAPNYVLEPSISTPKKPYAEVDPARLG